METNGTPMYMPVAPANGGGFGNFDNGWWIILLFLFAGGGMWGGFGNNGGGFVNADIQRGFDQSAAMSGISGIQNNVTSGFGDLQTALCGGFAGVNAAIASGFANAETGENARQMANMQQMFALQSQLSQCCCDNRMATVQTQNIVQSEAAATRGVIQDSVQKVMDKLCTMEIDTLKGQIVNLQGQLTAANLAASQTAQTAQIIAALTPAA